MFYDVRNAKAISTLCPTVQAKTKTWLSQCNAAGLHLLIVQGYRNWAQQAYDFAIGASKAKPGYSFHGYRCAFDWVPADDQGGIHYNDMNRYLQGIALAKALGFESGIDFSFKDTGHLQYRGGHDINYFKNGGTIPYNS